VVIDELFNFLAELKQLATHSAMLGTHVVLALPAPLVRVGPVFQSCSKLADRLALLAQLLFELVQRF